MKREEKNNLVDKPKKKVQYGIMLMIISSIITCSGQLMWKLASNDQNIIKYIIGFALYAVGALIMIIALQFGELSVLHPMLSFGYIASLFLGYFVLNEEISYIKIIGVVLIISGLISMSISVARKEKN